MANLHINQMYAIVRNAYNQITGITPIATLDSTNFASVASTVARMEYSPIIPGLIEQFGRIRYTERPYRSSFNNIFESKEEYGNHRGKTCFINPINTESSVSGAVLAETDPSWEIEDGQTFGVHTIHFEKPMTFHFYGKSAWKAEITFTRNQLKMAFASPEAMRAYLSSKLTMIENQMVQQDEAVARSAIIDWITAKVKLNSMTSGSSALANGVHVINLVTEFNDQFNPGSAKTYAELKKDSALYPSFCRFAMTRCAELVKEFAERDVRFHNNPTKHTTSPGYILRHTSADNLRMFAIEHYMEEFKTQGLVDTRNLDFIPSTNFETVNYWQSMDNRGKVMGKPSYMINTGEVIDGTDKITVDNVFAIMYDKDALSIGTVDNWTADTGMDALKGVANRYWHKLYEYNRDDTEKGVVITLN